MNKEDFVNHIMFTDCERCPIQIYCSFKSPQYLTGEDVARRYYKERMSTNGKQKASDTEIRMV